MELPKDIKQIGTVNSECKIYVEDYVMSFLKQLNKLALEKTVVAALYGNAKKENKTGYVFIYGAAKVDTLKRETRRFSQAQLQELQKIRSKSFPDYELVGYEILTGEMIDGFYIYDGDVCQYVEGYAQFYEKNDAMLTYMLDCRSYEALPEQVEQEKYDVVKKRQEERRSLLKAQKKNKKFDTQSTYDNVDDKNTDTRNIEYNTDSEDIEYNNKNNVNNENTIKNNENVEKQNKVALDINSEDTAENNKKSNKDKKKNSDKEKNKEDGQAVNNEKTNGKDENTVENEAIQQNKLNSMKWTAAAVFAVLCMLGIYSVKDTNEFEQIKSTAGNVIAEFTEQKLTDSEISNKESQSDTLVAQDKLTDAIAKENYPSTQAIQDSQVMQDEQNNVQNQEQLAQEQETIQNQEQTVQEPIQNQEQIAQEPVQNQEQLAQEPVQNQEQIVQEPVQNQEQIVQEPVQNQEQVVQEPVQNQEQTVQEPVAQQIDDTQNKQYNEYTIKKGDTLLGISLSKYGKASAVSEICALNNIQNPDDIKIGQKILLP